MVNVITNIVVKCLLVSKYLSSSSFELRFKTNCRNTNDRVSHLERLIHQFRYIIKDNLVIFSMWRIQLTCMVFRIFIVDTNRIQVTFGILPILFSTLKSFITTDPSVFWYLRSTNDDLTISIVNHSLDRSHNSSNASPRLLRSTCPIRFSEHRDNWNVRVRKDLWFFKQFGTC